MELTYLYRLMTLQTVQVVQPSKPNCVLLDADHSIEIGSHFGLAGLSTKYIGYELVSKAHSKELQIRAFGQCSPDCCCKTVQLRLTTKDGQAASRDDDDGC